jgi:hypothetical protein
VSKDGILIRKFKSSREAGKYAVENVYVHMVGVERKIFQLGAISLHMKMLKYS